MTVAPCQSEAHTKALTWEFQPPLALKTMCTVPLPAMAGFQRYLAHVTEQQYGLC